MKKPMHGVVNKSNIKGMGFAPTFLNILRSFTLKVILPLVLLSLAAVSLEAGYYLGFNREPQQGEMTEAEKVFYDLYIADCDTEVHANNKRSHHTKSDREGMPITKELIKDEDGSLYFVSHEYIFGGLQTRNYLYPISCIISDSFYTPSDDWEVTIDEIGDDSIKYTVKNVSEDGGDLYSPIAVWLDIEIGGQWYNVPGIGVNYNTDGILLSPGESASKSFSLMDEFTCNKLPNGHYRFRIAEGHFSSEGRLIVEFDMEQ